MYPWLLMLSPGASTEGSKMAHTKSLSPDYLAYLLLGHSLDPKLLTLMRYLFPDYPVSGNERVRQLAWPLRVDLTRAGRRTRSQPQHSFQLFSQCIALHFRNLPQRVALLGIPALPPQYNSLSVTNGSSLYILTSPCV